MLNQTFAPLSREFMLNPYPTYDHLRATTPILYHQDTDLWFFSTHEDIDTLLRDRRLGRSIDPVLSREQRGVPPPSPELAPFNKLSENSMFDKEPPDHTRLRSLVHKVFTPRRVESLRGHIQNIADHLLDQVQSNGRMEVLEDFAVPLPVQVIAELLGVPEADRQHLRPWSNDIVKMYELDHTQEQERRAVQAAIEFAAYLRDLSRERRRQPQDDLISALAAVEDGGDRLSEDELISVCVLLLNAGHEATVNVIGNGLWALFQFPDQLATLKANPPLVKTAIEELMRYDTPLQLFRRWVLEDMSYKDFQFRQGDQLSFLYGAANRDPARFANPNALDITREDNPHITFGGGIHYCLGAPLARLELHIAFGTLLRRLPNLQLDGAPEYRETFVIRGLKELWVRF
jgi:cytochrome P450